MGRRVGVVLSLWLLAGVAGAAAEPALPENAYNWKSGDVFRFEYFKSISLKQNDENGTPTERVTEVAGVLILEVRNVTPAGATATLRIDSPRVTLPEAELFSSQRDESEVLQGKNRSVARAIEGALRAARWSVVLGGNGLLYIESRAPKDLSDWLKDTETSAGWRKKFVQYLPRILEQDLGLKVPGHDRDTLLYLGAAPPASAARPGDNLRPRREGIALVSREGDKANLKFARVPAAERTAFIVPQMLMHEKIRMRLDRVVNTEGRAVFDLRIGMLDSLNEKYSAFLKYNYQPSHEAELTLDQEVRVEYRLRRLAPPITAP